MKRTYLLPALAGLVLAAPIQATDAGMSEKQTEVLKKLMTTYGAKAKEEVAKRGKTVTTTFTPEAGREFYLKRRTWQVNDYSCSGCHTENPMSAGKHITTGKPIKPLAPAANHERFTDAAKVEKNFAEHCSDLYGRDCFAFEKGNFIAYLMSLK